MKINELRHTKVLRIYGRTVALETKHIDDARCILNHEDYEFSIKVENAVWMTVDGFSLMSVVEEALSEDSDKVVEFVVNLELKRVTLMFLDTRF